MAGNVEGVIPEPRRSVFHRPTCFRGLNGRGKRGYCDGHRFTRAHLNAERQDRRRVLS